VSFLFNYAIISIYRGGVFMRCEYNDGLKVDYSGSLHIWDDKKTDVFMERDFIASNIRRDLDMAAGSNDCGKMRKIAQVVTDTVGSRVDIHE
jgi:hypothetical protein